MRTQSDCHAPRRRGIQYAVTSRITLHAAQQAMLMLHKTRELLVKQRTMSVNALRGHLAEFGIVAA